MCDLLSIMCGISNNNQSTNVLWKKLLLSSAQSVLSVCKRTRSLSNMCWALFIQYCDAGRGENTERSIYWKLTAPQHKSICNWWTRINTVIKKHSESNIQMFKDYFGILHVFTAITLTQPGTCRFLQSASSKRGLSLKKKKKKSLHVTQNAMGLLIGIKTFFMLCWWENR